jgi:hypothetical protein
MNDLMKKQREALLSLKNPISKNDRLNYSIKDLKVNSFLSIGVCNELFKVEEVSIYNETKWNFNKKKNDYIITELKLFSIKTGLTTYIEYEEDDELEITITTEELKLRDLKTNSGNNVTKQVIEDIAEEENGRVIYKGETYYYVEDETWAAIYNSEKYKDINVRMFEFESNSGKYLTIELWYDDDKPAKEAFLSESLNES